MKQSLAFLSSILVLLATTTTRTTTRITICVLFVFLSILLLSRNVYYATNENFFDELFVIDHSDVNMPVDNTNLTILYSTNNKNKFYNDSSAIATTVTIPKKEAIVIATSFVSPCLATRIRHFITTLSPASTRKNYYNSSFAQRREQQQQQQQQASKSQDNNISKNKETNKIPITQFDVYIMHSHYLFNETDPRRILSEQFINSIPGLYSSIESSSTLIEGFDTIRSKSSKSSFLRFLSNNKNYNQAWYIESDVFFTGKWKNVFYHSDIAQDTTSDVIAWYNKQVSNQWWESKAPCLVNNKPCQSIQSWMVMWFVIRISKPLAQTILYQLHSNDKEEQPLGGMARLTSNTKEEITTIGHHEALTASICAEYNYTIKPLPSDLVGYMVPGGRNQWRSKRKHTLSRLDPIPYRLYHPVACQAYVDGKVTYSSQTMSKDNAKMVVTTTSPATEQDQIVITTKPTMMTIGQVLQEWTPGWDNKSVH